MTQRRFFIVSLHHQLGLSVRQFLWSSGAVARFGRCHPGDGFSRDQVATLAKNRSRRRARLDSFRLFSLVCGCLTSLILRGIHYETKRASGHPDVSDKMGPGGFAPPKNPPPPTRVLRVLKRKKQKGEPLGSKISEALKPEASIRAFLFVELPFQTCDLIDRRRVERAERNGGCRCEDRQRKKVLFHRFSSRVDRARRRM